MKDEMGARIREARIEKGLTQAQAARKSGLGDAAVRLYELGKRTPSDEILARVADSLDVPAESLMNLSPSTKREALEMLFRLEDECGCWPVFTDDICAIIFDESARNSLEKPISDWAKMRKKFDVGELSQEDYTLWKTRYRC